ncbi:unnamed protein product [Linum trigynum]|uniref:Uncharacterized protein n=1 Tax=Linum trigynum TaxID=586398 RepID=A0AAV2GP85_9ROSI
MRLLWRRRLGELARMDAGTDHERMPGGADHPCIAASLTLLFSAVRKSDSLFTCPNSSTVVVGLDVYVADKILMMFGGSRWSLEGSLVDGGKSDLR